MKKIILILIFLIPGFLVANDNVGTAGMQFLKMGSDARANSMAGALVGEVDDVDSIYWNPAGVNYLYGTMLTDTYNRRIGDMNYFYIGYGMPFFLTKLGSIGFSITLLDEGSLEDTGNLSEFGDLNSYDFAVSGAYGLKLGIFSVGGALRYIHKKILNQTSSGGIIDVGGQLEIPKVENLKAGMVVKNLGWASKTIEKPDNMPIMYQVGGSYNYIIGIHSIIGVLSTDFAVDDDPNINLGVEYGFKKMLFARAGYKFETADNDLSMLKGLSFGLGGKLSIIAVDLNWISFGELGQSIQSTVSLNF